MSLILTATQQVNLSVSFVDKAGNAAKVDGLPVWTSSDSNILTVTPSEGGLSAMVATVGPVGTAQVSVQADADLGEGVTALIGTLDVEVVAAQAVVAVLAAATPEEKP